MQGHLGRIFAMAGEMHHGRGNAFSVAARMVASFPIPRSHPRTSPYGFDSFSAKGRSYRASRDPDSLKQKHRPLLRIRISGASTFPCRTEHGRARSGSTAKTVPSGSPVRFPGRRKAIMQDTVGDDDQMTKPGQFGSTGSISHCRCNFASSSVESRD